MLLFKWEGPSQFDELPTLAAMSFVVDRWEGRKCQGKFAVDDAALKERVIYSWEASYAGEGRWSIKNATNGRNGAECSFDARHPAVDFEFKRFITNKLNEFRRQNPDPPKPASDPAASAPQERVRTKEAAPPVAAAPAGCAILALRVRTSCLVPSPKQPRKYFDLQALGELSDSLKQVEQRELVTVVPIKGDPEKYRIVNGERRWRAAQIAGIEYIDVRVRKPFENELDERLESLILNHSHEDHTPMEISDGLHEQIIGGRKADELAAALGKSVAWVYDHLAFQRLANPLRLLLGPPTPEKDRLRRQVAKLLSHVSHDLQMRIYEEVVRAEHNPRIQLVKVRERINAITPLVPRRERELSPADYVASLLVFIDRIEGDMARMKTLPSTAFWCLVKHRGGDSKKAVEKIRAVMHGLDQLALKIESAGKMISGRVAV